MNSNNLLPRTFRAPLGLWFVAAIFTLLTLFFFFTVFFESAELENWLIAIFLVGVSLYLWFSAVVAIEADFGGVTWRMLWFERSIGWSDLGELQDNDWRIKLVSRDTFTKIEFNLQLSGYTDLLAILYTQRADLFVLPAEDVYRPQYWRDYERVQWLVVAGLFFFSGMVSMLYEVGVGALMLVLSALIMLYLGYAWGLGTPRHVQIVSGSLQLTYVNRVESFTIGQISQILYRKPSRMRRNSPAYRTEIRLLNGRVIRLGFAQQGTVKTYYTLRRWFESADVRR